MSVRLFVGPCFQAKGVEAFIPFADAEAKSKKPPQVREPVLGSRFQLIQLGSPLAKLIRSVEEFVISKQQCLEILCSNVCDLVLIRTSPIELLSLLKIVCKAMSGSQFGMCCAKYIEIEPEYVVALVATAFATLFAACAPATTQASPRVAIVFAVA
jgi:hypothetical protein